MENVALNDVAEVKDMQVGDVKQYLLQVSAAIDAATKEICETALGPFMPLVEGQVGILANHLGIFDEKVQAFVGAARTQRDNLEKGRQTPLWVFHKYVKLHRDVSNALTANGFVLTNEGPLAPTSAADVNAGEAAEGDAARHSSAE